MIAEGIAQDETLCGGCAFRLGTAANQSPITTIDADDCAHPGEQPFMCHETLDDNGNPQEACGGFAKARAKRKAAHHV